ncbi:MAG: DNA-processing protein DprA [Firmicutes bacterium]|nr:DNA-processing protein DprA [Bacillota bacterium]
MSDDDAYLLYWLCLLMVQGVGLAIGRKIMGLVPRFENAQRMERGDWERVGVAGPMAERIATALRLQSGLASLERVRALGTCYVSDQHASFPALLREIPSAPPILFYRGELDAITGSCVALVGTRQCTAYGRKAAQELACDLVGHGIAVVSGLALGIDQAAHEGALRGGGRTAAVLGSGIDCVYPSRHAPLARRIVDAGGCVLSEFLPWSGPHRHHFPQRNRIISGLSQAVVVVEAGAHSGALITAACALEQNREVMAVPGSVFSQTSIGAHELLAAGAAPALGARSVLAAIGASVSPRCAPGVRAKAADGPLPGGDFGARLLAELRAQPASLEELQRLARDHSVTPAELFRVLLQLEIGERVWRDGGRYGCR